MISIVYYIIMPCLLISAGDFSIQSINNIEGDSDFLLHIYSYVNKEHEIINYQPINNTHRVIIENFTGDILEVIDGSTSHKIALQYDNSINIVDIESKETIFLKSRKLSVLYSTFYKGLKYYPISDSLLFLEDRYTFTNSIFNNNEIRTLLTIGFSANKKSLDGGIDYHTLVVPKEVSPLFGNNFVFMRRKSDISELVICTLEPFKILFSLTTDGERILSFANPTTDTIDYLTSPYDGNLFAYTINISEKNIIEKKVIRYDGCLRKCRNIGNEFFLLIEENGFTNLYKISSNDCKNLVTEKEICDFEVSSCGNYILVEAPNGKLFNLTKKNDEWKEYPIDIKK